MTKWLVHNLDVILFLVAIGLLFYAVIFDEEDE